MPDLIPYALATVDNQHTSAQQQTLAHRLSPLWAALLAMAPFASVLLGQSEFYVDDHFRFTRPLFALASESLRNGHLPLWNPWVQTGIPLLSERGGMVSHPGMLLALVLSPGHAVGVLMVAMLGILAAGSTALLRALSVRALLAVALGAGLGLSGPAISLTSNPPFLSTLALWPWVVLFALRLARGHSAVLGGGLSLGLALLGGDLPGSLLAALVALAVFFAAGGRMRVAWPRLLGVVALALVVGAGAWCPVLWALPHSERAAGIAAREAGRWSFHPAELLGFVWPHPLGLPLPRFTLWPFAHQHYQRLFLDSIWIGALPAVASLLALRKPGPARAFAVTGLVLFVLSTGDSTPLWPLLRPLFTFIRYPSKLMAPAALLLAWAGAVVIEDRLSRPRGLRNLCLVVTGLAGLGAAAGPWLLGVVAHKAATPAPIIEAASSALRFGTLRVATLAGIMAGLFVLVGQGRLSLVRSVPLLAVLILVDVFATTAELCWTRPTLAVARPDYLPMGDVRGPRVMRTEEVTTERVALDEDAYWSEQLRRAALLSPLVNLPWHVAVLDPYGFYLGDMVQAMAELAPLAPLAMAEAMATDVVLAGPKARARWLTQAVDSGALRPTHVIPAGAVALQVAHPVPRSFVTTTASLVPRSEIPRRLAQTRERVLLSADKALLSGRQVALDTTSLPAPLLSATLSPLHPLPPVSWRPGYTRYEVDGATPSLLVEMDAFMPGWRVFVDGKEQPILQADVFGRAVVVPAGRHTVSWTFAPPVLVASLLTTWASLALIPVALLLRRRFTRSAPSQRTRLAPARLSRMTGAVAP